MFDPGFFHCCCCCCCFWWRCFWWRWWWWLVLLLLLLLLLLLPLLLFCWLLLLLYLWVSLAKRGRGVGILPVWAEEDLRVLRFWLPEHRGQLVYIPGPS